MKTLVLVRHGKSLYDEYVGSDILRHLAPRGYQDASDALAWCKGEELIPELMVSSPAIRAYSTAMIFANGFGYPPDRILSVGSIYEATVRQLLYVIASLPDKANTVFLFGHNPGFTDITNYLCGPVLHHLPTAGVMVMETKIATWNDAAEKTFSLCEFFSSHKPVR